MDKTRENTIFIQSDSCPGKYRRHTGFLRIYRISLDNLCPLIPAVIDDEFQECCSKAFSSELFVNIKVCYRPNRSFINPLQISWALKLWIFFPVRNSTPSYRFIIQDVIFDCHAFISHVLHYTAAILSKYIIILVHLAFISPLFLNLKMCIKKGKSMLYQKS